MACFVEKHQFYYLTLHNNALSNNSSIRENHFVICEIKKNKNISIRY